MMSMNDRERTLLAKLRDGNEWAFEILFKEYSIPLIAYADSILGDNDLAKEIVQDFFVKLWQNHERISITHSLKAYLFLSVKNNALKALKRERQHKVILDNHLSNSLIQESYSELEYFEFSQKVYKAIESLPEKTKEYFHLSRFENKSYKEIAEIKGVAVKTVEYHISKAIRFLYERVVQSEESEKKSKKYLGLMLLFGSSLYNTNRSINGLASIDKIHNPKSNGF